MKTLILLLPLFLVVIACNPKKDGVRSVTRDPKTNGIVGNFVTATTCPQANMSIGTIFDNGQQQVTLDSVSGTFESRVKAFLSASTAANEIGQISGLPTDQTGVRFQGTVKIGANGAVDGTRSKMLIKVYDSFVLNSELDANGQKFEAIALEFLPKAPTQISGQFNMQTGEGYASFRDSYGEVRFEGRIDAQNFSGVVKFQNTKNVNGGAALSGMLGQFYVARCAIIQ